jgi:two-component system LytT family sensor kinase
MLKKESIQKSFSEFTINFDFERFYTFKVRVLCHFLMWLLFTGLMLSSYYYGYKFTFLSAFFFSLRLIICNIVVFYILFYLVIPFTLYQRRFVIFILSIIICIQLWLFINHYFFVILYESDSRIKDNVLYTLLKDNYSRTILEIISPKNILAHGIEVILAISPFLFIKITFDLNRMYSRLIITNRKNDNLQFQNILIEKQFLQTQLNPHFLFNTLNNLYGLVIKKDNIAPALILKLSEIMRYTLYDINVETINIENEIEFIENYFDMEKLRYPNDYNVNLIIKNNSTGLKIPPLLFFTFIENAFKYGLKTDNPWLNVFIEIQENKVHFSVKNDHKSTINSEQIHYGGIGIKNIKKRLNLLYPNKHKLEILDEERNFSVELKLEL